VSETLRLDAWRGDLSELALSFLRGQQSEVNPLVARHIDAAPPMRAGPLCLAIATALGLPAEQRRSAALTVGLIEIAYSAAGSLLDGEPNAVAESDGPALALNSSDALYSLAHLALLNLASDAEGREMVLAGSTDFLSLELWRARERNDQNAAQEAFGRLAGATPAIAAGLSQEAVAEMAEFGVESMKGRNGVSAGAAKLEHLAPETRARLIELVAAGTRTENHG
jgi:hypothetical protein